MLADKGQNLGTVAPELDMLKMRQQASTGGGEAAAGAGSGWQKSADGTWSSGGEGARSVSARSLWQQKEEEAQRARVRTTHVARS